MLLRYNTQTPFERAQAKATMVSGRSPKLGPTLASVLAAVELIFDSGPSNSLGVKGDVEGVDIALSFGETSKRPGPGAARVVRKVELALHISDHAPVLC